MFYDKFVELCKRKGVSRTKACVESGASRTAWHKWEDGASPNGSTLQQLAAYFGVSVSYLMDDDIEKAPAESGERVVSDDDIMFALWGGDKNMDKSDLADVRRYADYIRERKKDK